MDGEKLSDLVTSENYGDYVDYPVDLGIGKEGTQDDWKLFYKNDDGRIFIIAADYVPLSNSQLKEAMEAVKMNRQNGDYCAYWSGSVPRFNENWNTQSSLVMATGYNLKDHETCYNSKGVSHLLDTEKWASFVSSSNGYGEFAIGGSTIKMWCAAWNAYLQAHPNENSKEITAETTNTNGYYVSSNTNADKTSLYMNGTTSYQGDLLTTLESGYSLFFPHTDKVGSCCGYWLASPGAKSISSILQVRCDHGSVGCEVVFSNFLGLRPVVCLNSGISATYDAGTKIYTLSK